MFSSGMLESILWMKRLAAVALFAAVAVAVALLSGQIMGASPSTSIAPITVERASLERSQNERARAARKKQEREDAKRRKRIDEASAESETVSPTPLPAGDDDDVDDEEEEDDAEPDSDDGVNDD
jgi:hypothetical protein